MCRSVSGCGVEGWGCYAPLLDIQECRVPQIAGRWLVLKSLEHYVQECMSFLHEMRLMEEAKKLIGQSAAWVPAVIQAKGRNLKGHAGPVPRPMPLAGLPAETTQKRPPTGRGRRCKGASRRARSAPAV